MLGRLPDEIDDLDPDHLDSLRVHLFDVHAEIHGLKRSRRQGAGAGADGEPMRAIVRADRVRPEPVDDKAPSPGMLAAIRAGRTVRVRSKEQIRDLARAIRQVEADKAAGPGTSTHEHEHEHEKR